MFSLDHFLPQAYFPNTALDYGNILYACGTCNSAKGGEIVPNPCDCMLAGQVTVHEDGSIIGTQTESRRLILKLGLDDPEFREFRRLWIDIVALAKAHDPDLFRRLMKYPDDLPNLAKLRPPANSLPKGIQQSCYARRARRELPEIY
jgi:hypothetical protein